MSNQLGTCPDCRQQYRHPDEVLPPTPASEIEIGEPMSMSEYAAELHRDIDCLVHKERDLIGGLRQVVQHFGAAGAVALLADVIAEDAADGANDAEGRPRDLVRQLGRYHADLGHGEPKERGGIGAPQSIAAPPSTPAAQACGMRPLLAVVPPPMKEQSDV